MASGRLALELSRGSSLSLFLLLLHSALSFFHHLLYYVSSAICISVFLFLLLCLFSPVSLSISPVSLLYAWAWMLAFGGNELSSYSLTTLPYTYLPHRISPLVFLSPSLSLSQFPFLFPLSLFLSCFPSQCLSVLLLALCICRHVPFTLFFPPLFLFPLFVHLHLLLFLSPCLFLAS